MDALTCPGGGTREHPRVLRHRELETLANLLDCKPDRLRHSIADHFAHSELNRFPVRIHARPPLLAAGGQKARTATTGTAPRTRL